MVVAQAHPARGEEWEQYSNVLSVHPVQYKNDDRRCTVQCGSMVV